MFGENTKDIILNENIGGKLKNDRKKQACILKLCWHGNDYL